MNISPVDRTTQQVDKVKSDKLSVLVAQRSLEAATQNQAKDQTPRAGASLKFAHPYLGHYVDIYV